MNILLIQGGWSTERDVSLSGAKVVRAAMERLGHSVQSFDPAESLAHLPDAVVGKDFAYIALHGCPGEDGIIQAMLDRLGVPYQGAGPAGSLTAIDKHASKALYAAAGLPTAPSVLLHSLPAAGWLPPFAFPVFVKSNTGGSSLNMAYVATAQELRPALERLFTIGGTYIMEPAMQGVEVTCGILGTLEQDAAGAVQEVPKALPPILIKAKSGAGFFDYQSKYAQGGAEEICPAPIGEELTQKVMALALQAHNALGLCGYSRTDFILTQEHGPMILETNTLPGMTATSLLPQEAAAVGLSFDALIERLLALGLACRGNGACCGTMQHRGNN